jgi:glycosyltransferase involved in cell wall biosynthesis
MEGRPANLHSLGMLRDSELRVLMGAVDVALNPVTSGSGTNLKMLHYAAAGVPIVSTPFGARGLALQDPRDLWLSPEAAFAEKARELLALAPSERDVRTRSARHRMEQDYDWRVIADGLPLVAKRAPAMKAEGNADLSAFPPAQGSAC